MRYEIKSTPNGYFIISLGTENNVNNEVFLNLPNVVNITTFSNEFEKGLVIKTNLKDYEEMDLFKMNLYSILDGIFPPPPKREIPPEIKASVERAANLLLGNPTVAIFPLLSSDCLRRIRKTIIDR